MSTDKPETMYTIVSDRFLINLEKYARLECMNIDCENSQARRGYGNGCVLKVITLNASGKCTHFVPGRSMDEIVRTLRDKTL